jgi:hypothetical protein
VRIIRLPSVSEPQLFGCAAAFVDSLSGELHAALIALRRLEGKGKGAAFAYEMELDAHRYGALIVLDRWSSVAAAFGPHVRLAERPGIVENAADRVRGAEEIVARVNQLIDAAESYESQLVEACAVAFRTIEGIFSEERAAAEQWAKLGPIQPEEYREARRIFLEDLAAR